MNDSDISTFAQRGPSTAEMNGFAAGSQRALHTQPVNHHQQVFFHFLSFSYMKMGFLVVNYCFVKLGNFLEIYREL